MHYASLSSDFASSWFIKDFKNVSNVYVSSLFYCSVIVAKIHNRHNRLVLYRKRLIKISYFNEPICPHFLRDRSSQNTFLFVGGWTGGNESDSARLVDLTYGMNPYNYS